ncbi:MAG: flagellar hook basal-body protein [Fusobacterium sp.]|nr:flagellar hook basal-body protein [Fusobacterium sp.]
MYSFQAIIRRNVSNVTSQFEKLGFVGNNLANYNTKGYKTVNFEQMLTEDGYLTGAIRSDYAQGAVMITSNPYDVAINGTGFIPVVSEDGEVAYTRDGAFKQGKNGYLVTEDDWIVGEGIKIPANCFKFEIRKNGEVFAYDTNESISGKKIGTIPLVRFASQENLKSIGMNKFTTTEDSGEAMLVKDHDCIAQNNLENSNTNIYTGVSDMLRLNASMIAGMRMMKVVDDMYNKSINIRE